MAGWYFDVQLFKSVVPFMRPMAISSALCFILSGIALALAVDAQEGPVRRHARYALGVAVMSAGLLAASGYVLSGAPFDSLPAAGAAYAFTGRMPPLSAVNFIFIGLSLLLINSRNAAYHQWLAISAGVISFLTFIGSAYGVGEHQYSVYRQDMSLNGSIAFLFLAAGILFARPETGVMRLISSERVGGFLVRRLLPAVVMLPVVLGWLRLKGEHEGLYTTQFGLLIFTASNIVILVAVIMRYTSFLEKSDIERLRAEKNLYRVNKALKTLSRCNIALVKASTERELLEATCATIVQSGGYRMASVSYAGEGDAPVEHQAQAVHSDISHDDCLVHASVEFGKDLAESVLRTGMPVMRSCSGASFASWREEAAKAGFNSHIALPLISEGKTFGALSIYSSEPDAFDKIESGLLTELADDLSFGIMALRTRAEHKRVDEENRLLKSIALSIAGAEDMRSGIRIVLNKVCEFTGWAFGEAWVPRHDGTALECAGVWASGTGHEGFRKNSERLTFGPGEGLPGRVWKLQEPEWVNDILVNGNVYFRSKAAFNERFRAALAVPITAEENVLAVLVFYRNEPGKKDKAAVKLASAVAAQLGSVIQRKLIEGALKESEHKYRLLVESIPQRLFLKDRNSVYVSCNGNYASDLGIQPGEIAGRTDYDLHPRHLAEKYRSDDRYIMESGTVIDIDEYYVSGGQEFYVHTVKTPVRDGQGNVTGVLGLFWDITESRRAEEEKKRLEEQIRQMQKMDAVGQLTSGIAHDFNNMLSAIMISGRLLDKKVEDPKLRQLVKQILSASEKAANLTKGLLAFSRKQVIEIKPVSLNRIVANLEDLLARIIGEQIEFRVELPEQEIVVMADAVQVEQALINLATNARDAMPEGGLLSIAVKTVDLDEDFADAHAMGATGPHVMICVSDTGTGMENSIVQKIFEPYFTTKEVGKGTGLGLSIVYGIVKQHNGFIDVYSEPGKGTAFKVYLPFWAKAPEIQPALPVASSSAGTETILLAEDNCEIRNLTKNFLSGSGYRVVEAKDGEDAIEKFIGHREEISLLILDVVMPKKNGKEVYSEASARKPGIKALFTSGYIDDIIHMNGEIDRSLDFIAKPYVPAEFLKKVREVLDS